MSKKQNKQKLNTTVRRCKKLSDPVSSNDECRDSVAIATLEDDILGVIVKGFRDHTWLGVNIAVTATSRHTTVHVSACSGLDGELHFDSTSETVVSPTNFGGTNG